MALILKKKNKKEMAFMWSNIPLAVLQNESLSHTPLIGASSEKSAIDNLIQQITCIVHQYIGTILRG